MARPLRIAMFLGAFPVISETFILRQITGLIELGHSVDLYVNSRPNPSGPVQPEVAEFRLLERTVYMDGPGESLEWEMPVLPITGRTWPPGSSSSTLNLTRVLKAVPAFLGCVSQSRGVVWQTLSCAEFGYQAASLSALYRLATLCKVATSYDVLHAHFGPVGNSFRFARRLWRAPYCVTFHGYDFSTLPRQDGADLYQKLFRGVEAVTVNSHYSRAQVEKLGCPANVLHLLPVGLDPARFHFRERSLNAGEPIRLLTVGRLVPIKGHEYVIRAMAKLRDLGCRLNLDIVGDGPEKEKLAGLIRELKLEEMVRLRGSLDNRAIGEVMDQAHIFILASVNIEGDQEGQGLALQEAQAAGLPVIATRHGALPEGLVEGESGYLVPERDVDALADRINYLMAHSGLWASMGIKGRKFVTGRYDIHKLNRELVAIYERLIENHVGANGQKHI